jgi:hypothetical protein
MEYRLDNRVVLSTEREHLNLYSWSIKEFDKKGKQVGGDQIPWDWSLRFEVIELIPTCRVQINSESDDQAESGKAELSEYLYGKLRPAAESRRTGLYSMFGTQREISEFGLLIYKATDGNDRCRLWGSVSYTSELDFEELTEQDSVQVYVYLSAERFDHLMKFVKFPRPTRAEMRLTGVSGFYSDWSPSIRTDSIKILANAKDQRLENPQKLDFEPPILGYVKEFDLTMQQQYPLTPKGS